MYEYGDYVSTGAEIQGVGTDSVECQQWLDLTRIRRRPHVW